MCCFLVPLTQAAVTSVARKIGQKLNSNSIWMQNLPTLEKMLWGGSVMLVIDHIINGELTWAFPFFTALNEVGGADAMLHELAVTGVAMSAVITALWIGIVIAKKFKTVKA